MKISRGYTAPGAELYTSSRADVEVDEMDLLRALGDLGVTDPSKLHSRMTSKEMFTFLENEADRFLLTQRVIMGDLKAEDVAGTLTTLKSSKLSIIQSVEARHLND